MEKMEKQDLFLTFQIKVKTLKNKKFKNKLKILRLIS